MRFFRVASCLLLPSLLVAQLCNSVIVDSWSDGDYEYHQQEQHLQQSSLSNPPTSLARKDIIMTSATCMSLVPQLEAAAMTALKEERQEHEPIGYGQQSLSNPADLREHNSDEDADWILTPQPEKTTEKTHDPHDKFYHFVNDNYPGLNQPPNSGIRQQYRFPHYQGTQQGRPFNSSSSSSWDSFYFYSRVHGQGRQINPKDSTLVRFQILDHRLVMPKTSSVYRVATNEYERDRLHKADQRIGTKYFKPQVQSQHIRVSDWYPASRTPRSLTPATDYVRKGDDEPQVLTTNWKRLYWDRRSDSLKVRYDGFDSFCATTTDDEKASKPPAPIPVPDLWKRVIRNTVISSCKASRVTPLTRVLSKQLFDVEWDPQLFEHERLGLYPGAGGDPSNQDGYFIEFSSPLCPTVSWSMRAPHKNWRYFSDWESAEPWTLLDLNNSSASVIPKRPIQESSSFRKGKQQRGPYAKTCKFWALTDDCLRSNEDLLRIPEHRQKPSGGYLSLLPEWRVVTGWIVITNQKTNELIEQHLVQVEVPEVQIDGSLQGETVCHCTW